MTEYPALVSMRMITVIMVRARLHPSDWAVESGMGSTPVLGSGPFPLDRRPAGRGQAAITAREAAARAKRGDPSRVD